MVEQESPAWQPRVQIPALYFENLKKAQLFNNAPSKLLFMTQKKQQYWCYNGRAKSLIGCELIGWFMTSRQRDPSKDFNQLQFLEIL